MVLGKLPVPGRPTIWITVGQGPTALAVGAGWGCLDIFTLIYPFLVFEEKSFEIDEGACLYYKLIGAFGSGELKSIEKVPLLLSLNSIFAHYLVRSGALDWLVGCFRFNGPLRQYFSLYRAVSQREGERGEK